MIRITRKSAYANGARSYKIFVDGVFRAKIGVDETKEFEVGNGRYTVYAKIDWYKSNILHINVDDSVVDVEVGTSVTGWRLLFLWVYATFWAHKYLWLKEKESTGAPAEDVK